MPPKMSSPYSLRIERFLQDSSGSSALPPNSYPLRYPHPHTNHQMHSPTPSRSTGNGEAGVRRVQEKPRLLLMGQRRCVSIQFFTLFIFPLSLFFSFFFLLYPAQSISHFCGSIGTNFRVRSGKSSISSVVFHKMAPTDTLFLESTTKITKDPIQ